MVTVSWIDPERTKLVIGSSRAPAVQYAHPGCAESRPSREPTLPDLSHDLLLSALGGEEAAIRRMVGLLTPVIHARVGRTLLRRRGLLPDGARERLDDLVQDVFVELFRDGGRALRAWDPSRGLSLANWVGLIAEQRTSAALRGRRRDLMALDVPLDEALEEQASLDDDPEASALARDKLEHLLDLLRAELSPLGLQLFYALIAEQESIPSVSARLGMSLSAVQAWSSRLKRRIAEISIEINFDVDPSARKRVP